MSRNRRLLRAYLAGVLVAACVAATAAATSPGRAPRGFVVRVWLRSIALPGPDPVVVVHGRGLPTPHTFTIRAVGRTAGRVPVRRGSPGYGEFVATAVDATGNAVSRFVLADPHVIRSELPDATGRLHGRILYRPSAEFSVILPDDSRIVALQLDRVTASGTLERLGILRLEDLP
ncbi:MAG: hypothetical protein ACRDJM_11285 [Actinomycetota bacterium]